MKVRIQNDDVVYFLSFFEVQGGRGSYMAINGMVFQVAKMNGALGVMLGSFIVSWGMSALYFIVGMSSILLFMKAIGKEKYERQISQIG